MVCDQLLGRYDDVFFAIKVSYKLVLPLARSYGIRTQVLSNKGGIPEVMHTKPQPIILKGNIV